MAVTGGPVWEDTYVDFNEIRSYSGGVIYVPNTTTTITTASTYVMYHLKLTHTDDEGNKTTVTVPVSADGTVHVDVEAFKALMGELGYVVG